MGPSLVVEGHDSLGLLQMKVPQQQPTNMQPHHTTAVGVRANIQARTDVRDMYERQCGVLKRTGVSYLKILLSMLYNPKRKHTFQQVNTAGPGLA